MPRAMTDEDDDAGSKIQCASPPCLTCELNLANGGIHVDRVQARGVARWCKVERDRLIAARLVVSVEEQAEHARQIARDLDTIVLLRPTIAVSVY